MRNQCFFPHPFIPPYFLPLFLLHPTLQLPLSQPHTEQHKRGEKPGSGGGIVVETVGNQPVGNKLEIEGDDGHQARHCVQPTKLQDVFRLDHVLQTLGRSSEVTKQQESPGKDVIAEWVMQSGVWKTKTRKI